MIQITKQKCQVTCGHLVDQGAGFDTQSASVGLQVPDSLARQFRKKTKSKGMHLQRRVEG